MPKIIEKPLIVSGEQCGNFLAYGEIEPELLVTPETPYFTRVLPAPFFYEKRLFFFLIKRYEPGEKSTFPNGGFEVRDEGGAFRSYDLDQVIIHPQVIKHKKTLEKMARRAEKEQVKRERQRKKVEQQFQKSEQPKTTISTGKRGRPPLDPVIKAAREAEKVSKAIVSKGHRGRPKGTGTPKPPKPTVDPNQPKRRRGRPALSPEAREMKAQAKIAVYSRSKGLRGRPKRK